MVHCEIKFTVIPTKNRSAIEHFPTNSTLNISYQSMHPSDPIRLESQQEIIPLFTIMSLSIQIGPFKPLLFTIISGFLSNAERDFVLEPPGGNLISITFSGFIRMF